MTVMPVTAYIALGSNLGERQQYLDRAVALLRATPGIAHMRVSSYHETEPVGGPAGQGKYLNAAAELQTDLAPCAMLRLLLAVEQELGRVRQERCGPRTLDLDLLLYGQEVHAIHEADCDLIVPHPRLHERLFVLAPLAEIAPLAVHPILQSTVADLLRRVRQASDLTGLRAVVTGSSSGIGQAIALALADAGAAVVVHGHRSAERAQEVARTCGTKARVLLADLRDEAACAGLVERAWGEGPIDVWINNAGADILTGAARHWSFERKLEELWQVDVRATILLARDVGRRMRERGSGTIINMSWDQAETGMEGDSGELFGACKGAVLAFSRSLALSLAPQVRVNCLAPGWIRTAWGEHASTAWQERVLRETPLQRWGTPLDVARVALWLASPTAAFVTGQVLRVNGGSVRG
jgi:2-amino-4-hydroxy-6-hydroxymethyldihydropteridine diphosphokinase